MLCFPRRTAAARPSLSESYTIDLSRSFTKSRSYPHTILSSHSDMISTPWKNSLLPYNTGMNGKRFAKDLTTFRTNTTMRMSPLCPNTQRLDCSTWQARKSLFILTRCERPSKETIRSTAMRKTQKAFYQSTTTIVAKKELLDSLVMQKLVRRM